MAIILPRNPKDGEIVTAGNRTYRWNQNKNRWQIV